MRQEWENAASNRGLEIQSWARERPTLAEGVVDGHHVMVRSRGRGGAITTKVTDYMLRFANSLRVPGLSIRWRSPLYWAVVGNRSTNVRRVGEWAVTSDDLAELDVWLGSEPSGLGSNGSGRGAALANVRNKRSDTVFTAARYVKWRIAADGLHVERAAAKDPQVFAAHIDELVGLAQDLS